MVTRPDRVDTAILQPPPPRHQIRPRFIREYQRPDPPFAHRNDGSHNTGPKQPLEHGYTRPERADPAALDRRTSSAHTDLVVEGHWALGRRVIVEDGRRDGTFMRVTWHPESNVFVVSHWRRDVCVAATRIAPDAAPDLVNLLVKGLAESTSVSQKPRDQDRPVGRIRALLVSLGSWLRPGRPATSTTSDSAPDSEHRRSA